MIKNTKQGELFFLLKLKAHFKTPKNVLMDDCDYKEHEKGNIRVLFFPVLDHLFGFNHKVYVCQDQKADMNTLMNCEKFVNSPIYEQFILGEGLVDRPNQYVMALVLKRFIWMITRTSDGYRGEGGISINHDGEGFTIVPIANYLKDYYGDLPDSVEYPLPPC